MRLQLKEKNTLKDEDSKLTLRVLFALGEMSCRGRRFGDRAQGPET